MEHIINNNRIIEKPLTMSRKEQREFKSYLYLRSEYNHPKAEEGRLTIEPEAKRVSPTTRETYGTAKQSGTIALFQPSIGTNR